MKTRAIFKERNVLVYFLLITYMCDLVKIIIMLAGLLSCGYNTSFDSKYKLMFVFEQYVETTAENWM